jgi:RNA polymerase sigma-70 factor (ECF subfamily)
VIDGELMADQDEEFVSFFNDVYASLCRFLECLMGGRGTARDAAADIAQESFLRLHRFGLYRLPANEARYWIFRVARNLALNEIDKNRTRVRLSDKAGEASQRSCPSPEDELVRAERSRLISELLQDLPERQRAALLLREQEEMSYQEIARVLGVSESSVKSDIFRARRSLRERWDSTYKNSEKICGG